MVLNSYEFGYQVQLIVGIFRHLLVNTDLPSQ